MADWIAAHIIIGGPLKLGLLNEFSSLARDNATDAGEADAEAAIEAGESLTVSDDQARYGTFEELEGFCRKHGLTYRRETEAKWEYDGATVFWKPGMDEPKEATAKQNGEPVVPLSTLKNAVAGGTLAELIAELEAVQEEVPSLTLIEG